MSTGTLIQDPTLWIGSVPEHWELLKGKELFIQVKRGVRDDDETVTAFRDGVVTRRSNRRTTGFTEAVQFVGYQGVEPGDLVIHQMDGFAGAIGVSDSRGRCSPVCAVSVPRDTANTYYYARVLRAMAVSGWIAALAKGIRERSTDFRFSVFREQILPVPPAEEQACIVRYLDHAELRIAKAIAGKSEVLAKLHEAKIAVIGDLVLGELSPDDGGKTVDLGVIPSAWSVISLRGLLRPRAERNRPDLPLLSVVRSAGVIMRSLDRADNHNFIPDDLSNYKVVHTGDLVINKMKAWSGSAGIARTDGIVSPAYFVYTLTGETNPEYMNLLFRSPQMKDQFARASRGVRVGQWDLSPQDIKAVSIPVPPIEEQREIARRIGERTSAIDAAMDAVNAEIALLKEYRTRLISDVVTGKIDVREEAAKLTDIDPAELAGVLAGGTAAVDEEEADDGDD